MQQDFKENSYDLVVSTYVIEHIWNPLLGGLIQGDELVMYARKKLVP